jgi:hypothetical protein
VKPWQWVLAGGVGLLGGSGYFALTGAPWWIFAVVAVAFIVEFTLLACYWQRRHPGGS